MRHPTCRREIMPLTACPLNSLTDLVIGASIRVHQELGPGLLESAYESCVAFELLSADLTLERQKPFPLCYRGTVLEKAFRVDLVINGQVVVEIKSVDRLTRVHDAQVLSYLRLTGCPIGLLFNFNVKHLMQDGFRRLIASAWGERTQGKGDPAARQNETGEQANHAEFQNDSRASCRNRGARGARGVPKDSPRSSAISAVNSTWRLAEPAEFKEIVRDLRDLRAE
jgi:GxxExxY protein